MVSCYGEVILNLLRGGSISSGGDGDTGDGDGGDDDGAATDDDGGGGGGGGGDIDLNLLQDDLEVYSMIASLMHGGRCQHLKEVHNLVMVVHRTALCQCPNLGHSPVVVGEATSSASESDRMMFNQYLRLQDVEESSRRGLIILDVKWKQKLHNMILLSILNEIYNSVDSCKTAKEMWARVKRNTSTGQCYNCGGKGHYARNCPKPRVRDLKYFMEQMLLAKQDEAGVILTDEQNDFLFVDASRMEEIKELSANICLMARIQPADQNSDDEPSYESAFISEVQSSSINENDEQMYPTHTKIINSTIDDDQINSNIQFDSVKGKC
ncbi:integrase, catalytic region, zinc finger, CCHC-type containing protein [Tanacetum coccineum]